ncbi:MAG: hypothetical protein P0120_20045 [Nitrospira sp.]|nr:hypothetical protein [Nitrospira sp.]
MFLLTTTGCGIGYNSLLFATKTTMGVDIDTTPPTAEIAITRHEGVIEPTFEQGKTLPVLASFNTNLNGLQRLFFGTSSAFAVGDAAYLMADCYVSNGDCSKDSKATLQLSKAPTKRSSWFGWGEENVEYYKPGYAVPVFFGTHSTLGLKVEWNGTTGQYPSALKLGYHRKELAWAPISMTPAPVGAECPIDRVPSTTSSSAVCLAVPSLLATMDSSGDVGTFDQTKLEYLQYFATGAAATELVRHEPVRKVMLKQILGEVKETPLQEIGEMNRQLAENLAARVAKLDPAKDSKAETKLQAIYSAAIAKGYIDPLPGAGGSPITAVTFAAHHTLIKGLFDRAATRSFLSEQETKRLKELLTII